MIKQWFKNEELWKIINSDNETTFILTFIEIFKNSINNNKLLFDKNINLKKKVECKNSILFSELHQRRRSKTYVKINNSERNIKSFD